MSAFTIWTRKAHSYHVQVCRTQRTSRSQGKPYGWAFYNKRRLRDSDQIFFYFSLTLVYFEVERNKPIHYNRKDFIESYRLRARVYESLAGQGKFWLRHSSPCISDIV